MLMDKIKNFFAVKRNIIIAILVLFLSVAGITITMALIIKGKAVTPTTDTNTPDNGGSTERKIKKFYDNLTGELISYSGEQYDENDELKKKDDGSTLYYSEMQAEQFADQNNIARINCVQIPNGTDARPQIGLTDAKIVYEAIAEGGITRFAALFRNDSSKMIGPVRSLRTYYLGWDTPYDCTIVHAGGEENALKQVKSYAHLSESTKYMWRDYYEYYNPNNLFTSAALLSDYNNSQNYQRSEPKVFERMTPDENAEEIEKIMANADEYKAANSIYVHVTSAKNYNVKYDYNAENNSYLRSYEGNSGKHMVYDCKKALNTGNKIRPKRECELVQVAPKVVIVMKVDEKLNQTNHYREDIETIGDDEAWIFQNGIVIEGTWTRRTNSAQLVFKDKNGMEISLAPGQTFITAIAKSYGYVKY